MKSRSKIIFILKNISFIILLALSVCAASFVLEDKSIVNKNKDFFEQDEDFDVLFFGSSHSELFFNPMILWKEYGIVSYNFGNPEEGIPVSYWLMKNAIEIHKPKVIVFDVSMAGNGSTYSGEDHVHYALDSFPISIAKIEAANGLLQNTSEELSFLFNLGYNHSRWKDISKPKNNFVKGSLSYGEYHTKGCKSFMQFPITYETADINDDNQDIYYINKMIELCKDKEIKLVLTANPFQCPTERQQIINSIELLSINNNVPFVNLIKMDSIIDFNIDLYDKEHVNQSGLNKMCNYWGSYLVTNYKLQDHRSDPRYFDLWEKEYDSFKQLKYESMWWFTDNIEEFLQMLHDKDCNVTVFVGADSQIYSQSINFARLIHNIGREDITVESPEELNSTDQMPLKHIDDCLGIENYAVLFSRGKIIEERIGKSSTQLISSICNNIDISSDDVIVIVSDYETNEIKLIRKYENSMETCENIYASIPRLYFED